MQYVHSRPAEPSLNSKGLLGYGFGPLRLNLEVHHIDVAKGHDTFQISKKITRIYYVISGSGYFTIDGQRYDVSPGVVIEVPPRVEYSYSGRMELVAFSTPRWFRGNDTTTRWNPDVVDQESAPVAVKDNWMDRLGRIRVLGKSPARAYLRINQRLWRGLPSYITSLRPVHVYGELLHKAALMQRNREQALATFFLRNRPQLELMRRLVGRKEKNERLNVAVLACSGGAEAYSVAWAIKSARPDLEFTLHAIDISHDAVELGKRGVYSLHPSKTTGTALLERMTPAEITEIFDRDGDTMSVKPWIRDCIQWRVGDVREQDVLNALGPQDIVIANNFLCHMEPADAESCLRSIVRLIRPGGYLFVGGIDLDVRTKVAYGLGWQPVRELLEEIHDGDPALREQWPCQYAGLEPMNKGRKDWQIRYAVAFRVNAAAEQSTGEDGVAGVEAATR